MTYLDSAPDLVGLTSLKDCASPLRLVGSFCQALVARPGRGRVRVDMAAP